MGNDEIIYPYFPSFTAHQRKQFAQLGSLYAEWNAQINVISRKDIDALYEKHVLHSLAIFRFLPMVTGTRVLDIGTGGGFPGIPLAIAQPGVQFVLSDSIGKKIKVVAAVAAAIGLKNVVAVHQRSETITGKFDFVLSRAVAPLPELMAWCQGKFKKEQINALPNGLICLKGGDIKDELKPFGRRVEVHDLSGWFEEPFFETKKLVYLAV